ncbi:DUF1761 domain-containing protein [Flexithrix dorotheae]|uniref:DUF1761 domain-containing protein n=1 Tax=Flexithrix dorotheae TaxID=70993 RepID=UPI000376DB9B|nr:DUF1761 domain-containing protein [Flexithrix dorotheae]
MELSNINYLAVGVAALASFALGALWYSPVLFGKAWQNELGFTDEYLQEGNMAKIFGSSFLLMILMAFGMGMLLQGHGEPVIGWQGGLIHGLVVGFFFVGTSMGINLLYQRKSFILWLIDAGYQIIFLGIMGIIIGAWS